jgi:hypothetical protein
MSEISEDQSVLIDGKRVSAANAATFRHLHHLNQRTEGPEDRFDIEWPVILEKISTYLTNNACLFNVNVNVKSDKFVRNLREHLKIIHNNYYARKYHKQSTTNEIDKAYLVQLAQEYRSLLATAALTDMNSLVYLASEAVLGKNAYDLSVYEVLRKNLKILDRLIAKRRRKEDERIPHIKLATVQCAQLYKKMTGKELAKTKPLSKGEFITISGQFVWEVMSAIDPAIPKGSIETAISALPSNIRKRIDGPESL